MKVMKFGGTSVGKPERMHHIAGLVSNEKEPVIVV
jgi:aspartate kinase